MLCWHVTVCVHVSLGSIASSSKFCPTRPPGVGLITRAVCGMYGSGSALKPVYVMRVRIHRISIHAPLREKEMRLQLCVVLTRIIFVGATYLGGNVICVLY